MGRRPGQDRRHAPVEARTLPRGPGQRDRVEKAPGARADARQALIRSGGSDQGDQRQPALIADTEQLEPFLYRQVRNDQPAGGGLQERVGEALAPPREHQVRVAHHDDGDSLGDLPSHREHMVERGSGPQCRGAGRLNHRTVRQRIGERHPQLHEVGPRLGVRASDGPRGVEVGKSPHQIRHQRRAAPLGARGRERLGDALDSRHRRLAAVAPAETVKRLLEVLVAAA